MSDNEQLWKKILADVQKEVSEGNFHSWLKPTTLIALDKNSATIGARDAMTMNMIQGRFASVIKQAFAKQGNKDIELVFVSSTPQSDKLKTNQTMPLFEALEKKPITRTLPRVRSDYTFEALAVSDSNRLAFVSAQRVAQHLGKSYNPLFIYGQVGVGKTHLMQAIANEVYMKDPSLKIIYTTSEEFTNEVVDAIRTNDTSKMKKRFRTANLLIIDDVQFIAGKDKVQEELFHTFNILIDNAAQIVLTSDRPPSEIKKLEQRLSSRFAGGLTVDVGPPDFELRTAIVLKKAEKFGFKISIDTAKIIAEREQDVRTLEGALLRVVTQASAREDTSITPSLAASALGNEYQKEQRANLHAEDVIKGICTYFGIKATQLKGPKRNASLVKARQITMYILLKELGLTLVEIGNMLGGRDHTTVIHGVDKLEKLIEENAPIHQEILGITKILRG